jgi:hypothetical protein
MYERELLKGHHGARDTLAGSQMSQGQIKVNLLITVSLCHKYVYSLQQEHADLERTDAKGDRLPARTQSSLVACQRRISLALESRVGRDSPVLRSVKSRPPLLIRECLLHFQVQESSLVTPEPLSASLNHWCQWLDIEEPAERTGYGPGLASITQHTL